MILLLEYRWVQRQNLAQQMGEIKESGKVFGWDFGM